MKVEKHFPELYKMKNPQKYKELFEEVYSSRKKKVGKDRAIISARARLYAEALKDFSGSKNIKKIWEEKKPLTDVERRKHKSYKIGDKEIIVSTDKGLLNDFPSIDNKGVIKDMQNPEQKEILFKLKEKFKLALHPYMYYVIGKNLL